MKLKNFIVSIIGCLLPIAGLFFSRHIKSTVGEDAVIYASVLLLMFMCGLFIFFNWDKK